VTSISIEGVSRSFGSVQAVRDVSLEVGDGEFFTLLGPSGCGKTTLLRMIAGFAELDSGTIRFGAERIDPLPPHRRNTGMVFQNYAIFPHLTVAGNVAYGLKARGMPEAERVRRVTDAIRLVQLAGHETRWPHQLSGGQLQRVAIARALVIEPAVLLLDEPLSNLDARLRVEMRAEIRQLQQALGITAIYVTHDQEEALAISDRIAVMRGGALEQIGRPADVYHAPATAFVAEFMGATNLLTGIVAHVGDARVAVQVGKTLFSIARKVGTVGASITLSLRPEALRLLHPREAAPDGWAKLGGTLERLEFLGALTRLEVRLDGGQHLRVALLEWHQEDMASGRALTLAYDPRRVVAFSAP
jgi:ABC-type Fe3+/spermidine/putrescine transport system ATPase subunit